MASDFMNKFCRHISGHGALGFHLHEHTGKGGTAPCVLVGMVSQMKWDHAEQQQL